MKLPKRREIIKNLLLKVGKTTFAQRVALDLMDQFARSVDPDGSMHFSIRALTAMKAFNESSGISLAGKTLKSAFRVAGKTIRDTFYVLFHRNDTPQNDVPKTDTPAPL